MADFASAAIRASIAGLPERMHEPWTTSTDGVGALYSGDNLISYQSIIDADEEEWDEILARHIAMLASPDVAEALADLLDVLSPPAPSDTIGGLARIVAAKVALEAAILKGADR